jgi:hypothetical protein
LDEFKELTQFMRERFAMGPPMRRGGPGRGFDGPPRGEFERRGGEGRRRVDWRDGPPGPPPREAESEDAI